MQLIYEKSQPGRRAIQLDALDVPEVAFPEKRSRAELDAFAGALEEVAAVEAMACN